MPTPLIAIPANVRPFGHVEPFIYQGIGENFMRPLIELLGFQPVILPTMGQPLAHTRLLDQFDGVLLTGGIANIHPSNYGQEVQGEGQEFDPQRDAVTLPLVRKAVEIGLPLLGICRGMQEINVAHGGSMIQQLHAHPGKYIEHRGWKLGKTPEEMRSHTAHPVAIQPGGILADILKADSITVNSLHEQGVAPDGVGHGLHVEAVAPDGTIEAISVARAKSFALGTLWHPEWFFDITPASQKIFGAFGAAVRQRHSMRNS